MKPGEVQCAAVIPLGQAYISAVMCGVASSYPELHQAKEACVKLKLFSVQSGNRKTQFDALEANVNQWLADHPNILIENTNDLSQPNMNWSHLGPGRLVHREVVTQRRLEDYQSTESCAPTCAVMCGIERILFATPTAAPWRPISRIGETKSGSRRLASFVVQRCSECDQPSSSNRNHQRHRPIKCDPRDGRYRRYNDHQGSHRYSSKPVHSLPVMIQ